LYFHLLIQYRFFEGFTKLLILDQKMDKDTLVFESDHSNLPYLVIKKPLNYVFFLLHVYKGAVE